MHMELTQHERIELLRYSKACAERKRPARAKLLSHVAASAYPVELRIYDKVMRLYRAWLVFNEI